MKQGDEAAIVADAIVPLVRGGEARLRDRLQAEEQRLAAALRCERDELLVTRRAGGALAGPPLPQWRERPEELLRVARARADVVVPEHNRACWTRGDFADDLVDGAAPEGPRPVEKRDRAVVAAMRTASRRDRDRLSVSAPLDEVPAWRRHARQRRLSSRYVDLLELAAARIVENARPRILGLADDDGVGVAGGLLRKSGRMRSADHDGHAATGKLPGEVIGVECGRRGCGDPHQVSRSVEPNRFDDLVRVRDVVLARGECRDQRHGELGKLDQPAVTQSARPGRLGGDQVDAHRPHRTGGTLGLTACRPPR